MRFSLRPAVLLASGSLLLACTSDGSAPGTDDTGSSSGAAYMINTRVQTTDARLMYTSVVPALDHGELDLSEAIEVSGYSRTRVFGDRVFIFDGEDGTITRYALRGGALAVDTLSDGAEARVSLASYGITIFSNSQIFLSDSRAYSVDHLQENQVVVWDPSEMTITSSFALDPFLREDLDLALGRHTVIDGEVVFPMSWTNYFTASFEPVAALGVIGAESDGDVRVIEDPGCIGGSAAFEDGGQIHLVADNLSGLADVASGFSVGPPCVLTWAPGSDAFDEARFDPAALIGVPAVTNGIGRGDGTMLVMAMTGEVDWEDVNLYEYFDLEVWQWANVSLDGSAAAVVEGIDRSAVSSPGWIIDGEAHIPVYDATTGTSTLYRVSAAGEAEALLTVTGELFEVARIQ